MNPGTYIPFTRESWKQLYRSAILEQTDRKIRERVTEAEHAIVARARELFRTSGNHGDEKEALEDAMYALHALETSCGHRSEQN
jgi:hypothetical protein